MKMKREGFRWGYSPDGTPRVTVLVSEGIRLRRIVESGTNRVAVAQVFRFDKHQ